MHTAQVAIRIDHPATGEPVDTEEELRQLLAWFRYEDAFRGQVRLDTLPTTPHQMGAGWVDAIVGGVSSGAAGALVASVIAWVERRRTRDKGGAVTIEFSTDDGKQLRLSCDSTTAAAELLDQVRTFFDDPNVGADE
ncbi:hypothetical protein EV191_12211 [Tamaricihabitans halophyticus]|uniref:Uncharacterized protein n=1 Tax=Tamaricihabitans halophyticus TaxID=1262583 RepID=A0A4R2Q481_9PSEU|nr:hypothetical protein [Tamaricihabitans halophyticus]TCP43397.1 hypothetical protein EV191_12211 [Tamaricihabitans halophyticus]